MVFENKQITIGAPKVILIIQAIIVSVLGVFDPVFPNPSERLLSAERNDGGALPCDVFADVRCCHQASLQPSGRGQGTFVCLAAILGMWLIAGGGFLAVAFALVVSFFPPTQIPVWARRRSTPAWSIIGLIVFCGAPFVIHARKKPEWGRQAAIKA